MTLTLSVAMSVAGPEGSRDDADAAIRLSLLDAIRRLEEEGGSA